MVNIMSSPARKLHASALAGTKAYWIALLPYPPQQPEEQGIAG